MDLPEPHLTLIMTIIVIACVIVQLTRGKIIEAIGIAALLFAIYTITKTTKKKTPKNK